MRKPRYRSRSQMPPSASSRGVSVPGEVVITSEVVSSVFSIWGFVYFFILFSFPLYVIRQLPATVTDLRYSAALAEYFISPSTIAMRFASLSVFAYS